MVNDGSFSVTNMQLYTYHSHSIEYIMFNSILTEHLMKFQTQRETPLNLAVTLALHTSIYSHKWGNNFYVYYIAGSGVINMLCHVNCVKQCIA